MDNLKDEELESLTERVAKAMNDKREENRYTPRQEARDRAKLWLQGVGFPVIIFVLIAVWTSAAGISTSVKVLEGFRAGDHAQIELLTTDVKELRRDVNTISSLQNQVAENARAIATTNAQLQITQTNYMTILEKVSQLSGELRSSRNK